jgi:hypothetical protein
MFPDLASLIRATDVAAQWIASLALAMTAKLLFEI